MKIFFVSYGVWEFDGRLRELVKSVVKIGPTKIISRATKEDPLTSSYHTRLVRKSFLCFIIRTIFESVKLKKIDVLFIDNRKAIIPGLIILVLMRPKKVVLDVRELYLSNEVKSLAGKIGCFFEHKMIKKSDVVICANEYRALFMEAYYSLNKLPIVYENVRRLECNNSINEYYLNRKYKEILNKKTFKIISTSGYSVSRTNDVLVKAMSFLGKGYDLMLVGGGTKKDLQTIQGIVRDNKLSNVHLFGEVEECELKFLINNSNVGVVNYNQNDSNNRYCASGKVYEFVFEGVPVVTTENRPLIDLCAKYGIGVSDNTYINAIVKIKEEYDFFKRNVIAFMNKNNVEKNNSDLAESLKMSLLI